MPFRFNRQSLPCRLISRRSGLAGPLLNPVRVVYGPTTVTSKGQVTIPQELRLLLQVQGGDQVLFRSLPSDPKQAMLEIVPTTNVVDRLAGSLATKKKYLDYKIVRGKAGYLLGKMYKRKAKQWKK